MFDTVRLWLWPQGENSQEPRCRSLSVLTQQGHIKSSDKSQVALSWPYVTFPANKMPRGILAWLN